MGVTVSVWMREAADAHLRVVHDKDGENGSPKRASEVYNDGVQDGIAKAVQAYNHLAGCLCDNCELVRGIEERYDVPCSLCGITGFAGIVVEQKEDGTWQCTDGHGCEWTQEDEQEDE